MPIDLLQIDAAAAEWIFAAVDGDLRRDRPALFYEPHSRGQVQFHRSRHKIRALFPGNRWGKTTALGVEVNCALSHDSRWGAVSSRPAQVMWFCVDFGQFDALRPQLEGKCFDRCRKFNEQKHVYEWPDGGQLMVKSDERDWRNIQGTNPDLIVVDEECPLDLWRELRARMYGDRETRVIVGATATDMAGSWMETEIYRVWKDFHAERGLDERQAMEAQLHPEIWCWPRGGIGDNPSMSREKVDSFRGLVWSSAKEKKVRDEGGFETSVGDPVFDLAGVEWLRGRRKELLAELGSGKLGWLERKGE